jgi:cytosine/adenosine deaminase-related metal-dependent hydrolase
MHQSYSPADTEADKLKFGRDPLVHLAEIGVLDSNVTLGHANYLTDAECRALIDSRTNVAWAPAASMMWGHGTSLHGRHAELWRRGANISLASDSGNWSNCFDLFRQANIALLTARDVHGDRGFLVAEDMLDMATRAGAISLGLADQIGSIETGKRADLVIHSLARPELIPATSMIRNLIYSSGSKSVSTVIVNGRVVLSDGSFVSFDEEQLLGKVNESALKLLKRVGFPVEANDLTRLSTRDRRSGF